MLEALSHTPELIADLKSWEDSADASLRALLECLRSDSIETRTVAADNAAKAGIAGKAATLSLVECLVWRPERPGNDRLKIMRWNRSVRELVTAATRTLAQLGQPSVAVFEAILNSTDKSFAAQGASLREVRDVAATTDLIRCLTSPNPLVRTCAAEALGSMGSVPAIEPLAEALRDSAETVQSAAAKALCGIGGEAALQQLANGLKDANESTRKVSLELGRVKDEKMTPFFVAALSDDSGLVVEQAAQALGRSRDPAATESLLKATVHPWPAAASAARTALKAIDSGWPQSDPARAAEPAFMSALHSEDAAVRRHAAAVLALMTPGAGPLVQALRHEPSAEVRAGLADAIAAAGDPLAVDPLLEVLARESDDIARVSIVQALGSLGNADAIEPLIAEIEPEDKPTSRLVNAVVFALGAIGDRRAVPVLIDILTAERFSLPSARAAAKMLGQLGGEEAIAALQAVRKTHWSDNTRGAGFVARDAEAVLAQIQRGV